MKKTGIVALSAAALAVAATGSPAAAQVSSSERLQVYGHLTQGYASSSDLPIFGIPTDGTLGYRSAALQFRYTLGDKDAAVLQFRHRKMGQSILTDSEAELGVEWAFYQRRFGNGSFKIGRVPLPGGIFNETRNVGTIIPFYRAPGNFYLDGAEAMDGAVVAYEVRFGDWSVEASAGGGQVEVGLPSQTPEGAMLTEVQLDRFASGQVWLNTPLHGVRLGASGQTWRSNELMQDPSLWTASVDVDREAYFARGEYREIGMVGMSLNSYYAQAGVRLGRVGVSGQADFADTQVETPFGPLQYQSARDLALGLSFRHAPNLVYKVEGHRARGTNFDTFVDPMGPKGTSNYFIGSVSVSF